MVESEVSSSMYLVTVDVVATGAFDEEVGETLWVPAASKFGV